MLPLTFANSGQSFTVSKINGKEDIKKHLEDLGFVTGTEVEVVSAQAGNIIVKVMGARLAITSDLAKRIMVEASFLNSADTIGNMKEAVKAV